MQKVKSQVFRPSPFGHFSVRFPRYNRRYCGGNKWQCVDFKVVGPVKKPVTLDEIKAEPKLKDMVLVNNSRLSVQPVTASEWKAVCKMAGVKA